MNATVVERSDSAWAHFRRELPGPIAALVLAVAVSFLWHRAGWANANLVSFATFSLVQTTWQGRKLIAHRPSRGVPLALGLATVMVGVYYLVARLL